MTGKQLELSDMRRAAHRKRVGPELARRMIATLAASGGWVTRAQFRTHGLNDRQCRLGREHSHGRIIVGQHGYKLLSKADAVEIAQALGWYVAQIKGLQKEHATLCRRAHAVLVAGGKAMA